MKARPPPQLTWKEMQRGQESTVSQLAKSPTRNRYLVELRDAWLSFGAASSVCAAPFAIFLRGLLGRNSTCGTVWPAGETLCVISSAAFGQKGSCKIL